MDTELFKEREPRRVGVRRTGMRRIAPVVLALLLLAACGDDSGSAVGTEPDAADPWGRTFVADGPPPLRLIFRDGDVTAQAECNHLMGTAAIDGGVLVVVDMGSTEMGCDPGRHAYDEWLAGFLTSSPTIALDGATLTLTGATDSLVLTDREVAQPDRPLEGTRWVVDGLITGDAVSSMPAAEGDATVEFTGTKFGGFNGCNAFGGDVVVGAGTLEVSNVGSYLIGCASPAGDVEAAVMATFVGTVTYEIDADRLTLTGPDGHGLMLRAAE